MSRAAFFIASLIPCLLTAAAPVEDKPFRTAADRPIDIHHIRLNLQVDLANKTVDSTATLDIRALRALSHLVLDAVDFRIRRVELQQGEKTIAVPFTHDGKSLTVDLEPCWKQGTEGTLIVHYRVCDPKDGLHFFGPTSDEPDVPLTVWSQGESVSNRHWFPCFDHPDQRQTTEVIVTVPEGFEALSNGKLLARTSASDKRVTFHWKQDQPHAAYLVTLVVGPFDVVEETWRKRPVLYYVPKGRRRDVARTFGRTREMMTFFSERFGIEYPWAKYAQVVAEQYGGGMENTSATTLDGDTLLDERAALDSSTDELISHELAHQWWGDLLTCRDWTHLWLNEGFAEYSEVLWTEHHESMDAAAYRLFTMSHDAREGRKDRPIVDRHYSSPESMFDDRAYTKGAWVLHMLRQRLGEEGFWRGIQRYGCTYRLQCVETSDFRKILEQETGRNLERFFYDWTERPGHPILQVASKYLPDTKQLRVRVKQTQDGDAFHFPLTVSFGHGESNPTMFTEDINQKEQVLYLPVGKRPTYVSLDPMQAILAEIQEEKSEDWWLAQLQSGDVAARARAAEHFGEDKTSEAGEALVAALQAEKFWGVAAEIAAGLGETGGDVGRDALISGLSNSHPKVRRACAEQLGKFPGDAKAATALKQLLQNGDVSYLVEASALAAYGKLHQPDVMAVLLPWLAKPSHKEVLRVAVLQGMAGDRKGTCLDTMILWTKRGKPRRVREAALKWLAKWTKTANPTDEQKQKVLGAITPFLEKDTSTSIRFAAVSALRDLGQAAAPALDTLEELARHDSNGDIRDLAQETVDTIHQDTPLPVEVTRLRKELERLRHSHEELSERLKRWEKIGQKKVKP